MNKVKAPLDTEQPGSWESNGGQIGCQFYCHLPQVPQNQEQTCKLLAACVGLARSAGEGTARRLAFRKVDGRQ